MKPLLAILLLSGLSAVADPVRFYLGSYTENPLSKGIYTGTLDPQTGQLGPVTLAAKAVSPSFLAFSPDRKVVYAAAEGGQGTVSAFRKEADGSLTLLNEVPSGSVDCHVSVDATGHTLFLASYGSGNVSAFSLKDDGSVDHRTAFVQETGTGPNPVRQTQPHLHSMYHDPENRRVYACDLGTDHVYIFDYDPATSGLTPAQPPFATVPPGSGPRHLAWSPDGRFAYVNGEMGLNVTVFSRDPATGTLTAIQTIPTLPPGADTNGVTTAEILFHPSGRWLYVSNRGCGTIAVYARGEDGKLTWVQNASAQVMVPRGFGLDRSGKWLLVGGQSDNKIAVLKIDGATGKLSATDQTATVGAPVCVIFDTSAS